MAKYLYGIVENINGKEITINGQKKQFGKSIDFATGDNVQYSLNQTKQKYATISIYEEIKEVEKREVDSNKGEVIDTNATLSIKSSSSVPPIPLKDFQSIQRIKKTSNHLIKEYINGKYDFSDITNAQFSSFHDVVAKHKYNFEGQDIDTFIEERITRDRGTKFYKGFKENFLGKLEDIYFHQNLQGIAPKVINKELFLLLKKYYRYEGAKKFIKGEK